MLNDEKMKVVFKKQKGLSFLAQVILFLVITSLLILLFKSLSLGQIGCMLGQQGYWDQDSYYFCDRVDYWEEYLKPMNDRMGIETNDKLRK